MNTMQVNSVSVSFGDTVYLQLFLGLMNNRFFNWLLFFLLCLIWGSSFKLMKDSIALSASGIAALRIFAAGIVFLPFAIFHFRKIPRKKMGLVISSAIFGNLLPAFLFAEAILHLDASLAGILNSLTPLCVVIIAILFFRDRIQSQKIVGVLIGFAGLVLLTVYPIITGEKGISFSNWGYTLLIFLATLSYGVNVNMVGHYLKDLNPVHVATVSIATMTVPTAIVLWQQGFFHLNFNDPVIQKAVLSASGLGIMGTAIATVLFYILLQRAGGLFASLVTYGVPFIALAWGFVDDEKISVVEIACLGIILLGVYLVNRKPRPAVIKGFKVKGAGSS
jgi:drug/metabolite transporter (DMT)-like permease